MPRLGAAMKPRDTRPRDAPIGASINIPEYYDRPQLAANVWRLTKGTHVAVCAFWTHPTGGEVRVEVDGELIRSEAHRDGAALFELSEQWRIQFQEKEWLG
jgi:hypothetical protein